ncbi:hypothetical protein HBI79_137180 [Parastagonospora nodorum]|nr:hypothetical protein HBI79_137180 [Parastagonospora nodorum]
MDSPLKMSLRNGSWSILARGYCLQSLLVAHTARTSPINSPTTSKPPTLLSPGLRYPDFLVWSVTNDHQHVQCQFTQMYPMSPWLFLRAIS